MALLNIDPTLYLRQNHLSLENLTVDIKTLDEVDEEDYRIRNYYRIPMVNENQVFNKTETINKVIQSCTQMVSDPFEGNYYYFFPALILNILKKNQVVLSQAQKHRQIHDCLQ